MVITYTNKGGLRHECLGIECNYSVSTFSTVNDLNKALEWYEEHSLDYMDVKVRNIEGDAGKFYQILSLTNDSFYYYYDKARNKAMGA